MKNPTCGSENTGRTGARSRTFAKPARGIALRCALVLTFLFPTTLAHAQVLSGDYTGDGTSSRVISELGFTPDVVIVKGNTAQTAAIRTSTMVGDLAKPMTGATALTADLIESLDSGATLGFTVG